MTPSTKLATGLTLACTWATAAQAEDYRLDVVTTQDISHARVYTYRAMPSSADISASPTRTDETVSADLGTLFANQNYTFDLSTNYGTSAATDFPFGPTANLNVLGTFDDGDIAAAGNVSLTDTPFTSVAPGTAVNGILSGDLPIIRSLTADQRTGGSPFPTSTYGVNAYQSMGGSVSVDLFRFDTSGTRSTIGRITASKVTAVPEPATLAALGMGGLALLRRRRKA